jgi:hypothetical protein
MPRNRVVRKSHYDVKTTVVTALITVSLLLGSTSVRAGKLDETRSAARSSGDRGSDENGGADNSNSSGSDSSGSGGDSDADMVLACLIPFVLPFCLLALDDDEKEKAPEVYFLSYPYAGDHHGHLLLERPRQPPRSPDEDIIITDSLESGYVPVSRVTGRLTGEYYYDLDTVHVPGVSLIFDSDTRLGFETRWRLFLEPLDDEVDKLVMGHLNMNVRLVQRPSVEAHLGIGGRLMTDKKVTGGVNSTFRLTLFPIRPVTSAMEVSIGNLGYAFFLEGQTTLGAALGRAEIFAGYRGTLIHGRSNSVVFHGPTAGISAWF